MIITIDGPAGAGKSSVSRALAERLQYTYIDTGAMYRAIALAAHRSGIAWEDAPAIAQLLPSLEIEFHDVDGMPHIFLNGEAVEQAIRAPEISKGASAVAALPSVRTFLLSQQRRLGEDGRVVLEGRDVGTVVFPHADVKFYLFASSTERARRRMLQLGRDDTEELARIQAQIEARDRADSEREIAPLRCPENAVRVDSSTLSLQQVVEQMLSAISVGPSSPA